MKILAVDDNAENRYLLEVMLKGVGHDVVTAQNGVEALDRLHQDSFDLIISDILMPRMDGYRLCRECKRDPRLRNIPFIFVTSTYTDEKDEKFALDLGADRFLRRPVEPQALIDIVTEALAERQTTRTARASAADGKGDASYFAQYAERLVNKLEDKIQDLETEIRARRQAEDALRESEERYRSLVTALLEGVVMVDETGAVKACNASAERLLGLSCSQMLSIGYLDRYLHPIDERGVAFSPDALPARMALRTGKPCHHVTMGLHKRDGSLIWVSVNAQPLFHPGDPQPYAVVASFVDITEQKKLAQELEYQAKTDSLTDTANRRHFLELAEQAFAMSRRYRHPLSLLMLDVDHFKEVNDVYGHYAGDVALQAISRTCQHELRDVDVIGRLGGEEFCVLLPETSPARALRVAERLRHAIESLETVIAPGVVKRVTVSIGVATRGEADTRMDILLKRADDALYEAKQAGRNCVRVALSPPATPAALPGERV
jgi:diguanylate cyclase (GGDEF)-like protein/PAS domain S-box-containing protein